MKTYPTAITLTLAIAASFVSGALGQNGSTPAKGGMLKSRPHSSGEAILELLEKYD